ncbi:MAG: M23 family metallopeptidase [Rhodospirillaceae bacterium]|nr:M23 family metallopeptidase [Rhodospirillaceae bacterium]
MIRTLHQKRFFFLFALMFVLSACGWAEWPPPEDGPRATNRPQTSGGSATAFVNADAVIVGKGDTVYGLSKRHRVSARAIIQANHLQAPYVLTPGQRLVLPRARNYVVKRGDSLSVIAENQNADMYAIARLNGLRPPYTIQIGQRLTLPDVNRTQPVSLPTAAAPPPKRKSLSTITKPAPQIVEAPPARTGKGFLWPVRGKIVSAYGGKSEGLKNDGINIAAPRGAQVVAAENGIVAYAGNELRGFGNLLLLKHTGGWITAYAHNETLLVKRGDKIKKGQTIAKVGSSGSVQVPQLHFELRKGKKAIDPIKYLPKV